MLLNLFVEWLGKDLNARTVLNNKPSLGLRAVVGVWDDACNSNMCFRVRHYRRRKWANSGFTWIVVIWIQPFSGICPWRLQPLLCWSGSLFSLIKTSVDALEVELNGVYFDEICFSFTTNRFLYIYVSLHSSAHFKHTKSPKKHSCGFLKFDRCCNRLEGCCSWSEDFVILRGHIRTKIRFWSARRPRGEFELLSWGHFAFDVLKKEPFVIGKNTKKYFLK